jgi:hypothetical protein
MLPVPPPRARHAQRARACPTQYACLLLLACCALIGVVFRVGATRLLPVPRAPTLALIRRTFQRLVYETDPDVFGSVWALRAADGGDTILTASERERDALITSGVWVETCSPLAAQSAFCVRGSELDLQHGSFVVVANATATMPARRQRRKLRKLVRCVTPSTAERHFFSIDRACEGIGNPDAELGWVAERADDDLPRALRRCVDADGVRVHSLDKECEEPYSADPVFPSVLGYVK